ncbi:MAG TPA: ABC transporter permease subunit, partial [Thermoplasmata archaeon]|nr:ABC transporter permease subunit [Thermoplasmata archaeon]
MAGDRQSVRVRSRILGTAPLLPVVAFVAAFAIVPAALLLAHGVAAGGGAGGIERAITDPLNVRAIENSLDQGGVSAAIATVLGFPAGAFLGRYSFRGRQELLAVLIVPFLLPTLAVVLGVETLFGAGGLVSSALPPLRALGSGFGGIVTANVLYNAPVVALLTAVGVEAASRPLEETIGTLGGGPWRSFRDGWGPSAVLGAASGAVLTFLFSALAFAAPLLLCGARCYTVEARIWSLAQILLSPESAAVLALVLVGLLALPAAAYLALLARLRAARTASPNRSSRVRWSRPSAWPLAAATAVLCLAVFGLLGSVLYEAFRPPSPGSPAFSGLFALFGPTVTARLGVSTAAATANTVFFASVGSAIAVLFAIATGFGLGRGAGGGRWLRALVFAPLVISPVVLSFALAQFWRPAFGGTSTVGLLILLAQSTLALPFALPAVEVSLRRVPPSLREAAATLGARP